MKLTLAEAAQALGKSPRQLRYLLKSGEIQGQKIEGRWMFDASALPISPARAEARQRKAAELGRAVEEALGPHLKPAGRKGYSVTDLGAFRTAAALARASAGRLGGGHLASAALRNALIALAQGCHRFHQREKAAAFSAARERAAEAVAELHLEGGDGTLEIASAVEQQLLPAVAGLLRRQERKEQR